MGLLDDLLIGLPDGKILQVCIGLHWTAVLAEVEGERRCGLCSTLSSPHQHRGEPQVPQAGLLHFSSGQQLALLSREQKKPALTSVGIAALNALLAAPPREMWFEGNAEQLIASHGAGKQVAMVGHFPFVSRLRRRIRDLYVLELDPREGDLPAEAAPDILPACDLIALTGMTLANHTLEGLLKLCSPQAIIMVIGPSVPLSPQLYDYGVDMLCGARVEKIEPVLRAVRQGANFRQIHKAGARLITIARSGIEI